MNRAPRRDRKIPPPSPFVARNISLIFVIVLGIVQLSVAFIDAEQSPKANKPAPVVIRELGSVDRVICAEYTSPAAPRQPNRSCVPAAMVRAWILANGREDCP